jgi:hypothetical protein
MVKISNERSFELPVPNALTRELASNGDQGNRQHPAMMVKTAEQAWRQIYLV